LLRPCFLSSTAFHPTNLTWKSVHLMPLPLHPLFTLAHLTGAIPTHDSPTPHHQYHQPYHHLSYQHQSFIPTSILHVQYPLMCIFGITKLTIKNHQSFYPLTNINIVSSVSPLPYFKYLCENFVIPNITMIGFFSKVKPLFFIYLKFFIPISPVLFL